MNPFTSVHFKNLRLEVAQVYKTKYYSNEGAVTILARSSNARGAYDAHKKALSPEFTEEAQAIIDDAWKIYKESDITQSANFHLLSDDETNDLAIERQRKLDEAHSIARSLTPYYPEDPKQIITTNAKGIIVAYGDDMKKLRKAGKVPAWM
jgi:hypothetical protein